MLRWQRYAHRSKRQCGAIVYFDEGRVSHFLYGLHEGWLPRHGTYGSGGDGLLSYPLWLAHDVVGAAKKIDENEVTRIKWSVNDARGTALLIYIEAVILPNGLIDTPSFTTCLLALCWQVGNYKQSHIWLSVCQFLAPQVISIT